MSDELRRLANKRYRGDGFPISKDYNPNRNYSKRNNKKSNKKNDSGNNIDKVLAIMNGTYFDKKVGDSKERDNIEDSIERDNIEDSKKRNNISDTLNSLSNLSNFQLGELINSTKKDLDLNNPNFIFEFFSAFDSLDSLDFEIKSINSKSIKINLKSERKKLKKLDFNDLCDLMDVNPDLAFSKGFLIDSRINQLNDYYYRKNSIFKKENHSKLVDQIFEIFYDGSEESRDEKPNKNNSVLKESESYVNKYTYFNIYSLDGIEKLLNETNQGDFKHKLSLEEEKELNDFMQDNLIKIRGLNKKLSSNDKYITKSMRDSFINNYGGIFEYLSKFDLNGIQNLEYDLNILSDFKNNYESLLNYTNLHDENENLIKNINENYVNNEIQKNSDFFEKLSISDLAKKRAIVIDEDNIKVIAGAGTGKTFTLQSKVKYLIEKKGISPEKILCLCYTSKGANELDKKVNNILDESNQVEVCTFHEFSRRVDRYCGNIKTTNRYLLDNIIRNYMKFTLDDTEKIDKLMEYFSYYMLPPTDKEKFDSLRELEEYERGKNLDTLKSKYDRRNGEIRETLNGEFVNSIEELIIANFLFMHEIEYEYECSFPDNYFADFIEKNFLYSGHFLSMGKIKRIGNERLVRNFINWERRRKRYQPDFYLPEYDIYLEHFGVDKDMEVHWLEGREKLKYEIEMNSKRLWHKMYGTKLIETYSYYMKEGHLLESLEELLIENGVVIGQRDKKEMLEILLTIDKINDYKNFINLIKGFINIFEAKYYPRSKFNEFKSSNKSVKHAYVKKRQELFFDIVEDIYDKYYQYNLGEDIDHNREISNALELIEKGEYDKKYDYILIDEYQDINFVRCKLLQEIQKSSGAKIFAVGDDWQSIYKFNGSDVSLFIDFDKYFPYPEIIKIEKSRRNPTKINDISTKFILKNKRQHKKELRYYKETENVNKNPLKIVRYSTANKNYKVLKLEAILDDIVKNSKKENPEILILGRKNDDINGFVNNNIFLVEDNDKFKKIIYTENRSLDITFMTVHKAKGLEYDEVVVINLVDKVNGFPIKIEDDPLLDFVKTKDSCLYAEERRLFYVALTRSRNNVYLLTPTMGSSIFITELTNDFNIEDIELEDLRDPHFDIYNDNPYFKRLEKYPSSKTCPKCGKGKIVIVVNNRKGTKFVRCTDCDYNGGPYPSSIKDIKYIEPCPSCRGILVRQGNILRCCLNYHEGCRETKEVKLDKEDLDDEL